MEFFKRYFSGVDFENKEEVKVHCPFHGDDNPSASVNTQESLFRCHVCKKGYNELGFIAAVNNIPLIEATKILNRLDETLANQWGIIEKAELWADQSFLGEVRKLGLSDSTIEKLDLGLVYDSKDKKMLGIPIYYNTVLMDIRRYNLLKHPDTPKMIGNADTEIGHVFPYDLWVTDKSKTYIVEGEKDALIARELGLNAITLTGGAGASPNELVFPAFKDREVVICYDNDKAGEEGAYHLFHSLRKVCKSVKYVNIGDIVAEDKEDFFDAVHKYNMDIITFLMLEEHDFNLKKAAKENTNISIRRALTENLIKKKIGSIVNVSAEYSEFYALPIAATATKTFTDGKKSGNSLEVGDTKHWYFDKTNRLSSMLSMIEVNAKSGSVIGQIIANLRIPADEKFVEVKINAYETIYKYKIIDSNSRTVDEIDAFDNTSLDLYTFKKMNVGSEYEIEYIIFPHPEKNQKLVAVALEVFEMNSDRDFILDKEMLVPFISTGSVKERVDRLYKSARHYVAKHLNYHMWLMEDLTVNSILEIDYGVRTWGALDVFILGDTATGKSESASGLVNLYNFGHFLSLKTSTTIGLIGGSKKDGDGMLNTIGAIPRQHKKLVVMEEFSGADPSFIKTMTDVRTTRRVHLVRVAGELDVPCNLRMITISNPIGDERGLPKYLSTFPNGVMPLMELINNPEDVGRYDGYLLVPQITTRKNPFSIHLHDEVLPRQCYEYKAKWVYTRKPENVKFDEGVEAYIWDKAEELNKNFECNFPLFGTKAPLKLARFSVALASLIMNVDSSYENIIVTKEIVDFIMEYFYEIYDNPIFKLKDYKLEYDAYNLCTENDVRELQDIYPKNSNIIDYMENTSVTSLENLKANSGYDSKEFNALYSKLSQLKFVRIIGRSIIPTAKFRTAVKRINKSFTISTGSLSTKIGG
jgi:hypothetical protein